ncbi:MAG TPA: hydrogenase maturation protease [Symbiobacteriaceae bacterium]|jgi:hydrogenase maturation protease
MTVVVGCGNLFCADDGAGVLAVRQVPETEGVRVIEAGCPGLGLLDLLAGARRAVLVDAVLSGAPPGTLHRFGPGALPVRESLPLSLHGVNLIDALALGRLVAPETMPPEIIILGIEIADRTPGGGLSPAVAVALPQLVAGIQRELEQPRGHVSRHALR